MVRTYISITVPNLFIINIDNFRKKNKTNSLAEINIFPACIYIK